MLIFSIGFLFSIMTKLYSISWLSKSPTMRPVTSYKFWLLNQRLGLPQLQNCLFLQTASQYLIPTVFDHTECDLYPRPWSYGKPEKKSHAVKGEKHFSGMIFFSRYYPPVHIGPWPWGIAWQGKEVGHVQDGSEAIPRIFGSQLCLWRKVTCVVREG